MVAFFLLAERGAYRLPGHLSIAGARRGVLHLVYESTAAT